MNRLWPIGGKPVILAHRAGGDEEPENSLTAFTNLRAKGFRFIETDAHATSDGVVVLFHDDDLSRTTDSTGAIRDLTWADVSRVRDHSGNAPVRLDDVLEEFPDLVLNVDAKEDGVVGPLVDTIRRHGARERISLSSFSEPRLKTLRGLMPGVVSSLGTGAVAQLVAATRMPKRARDAALRRLPGLDQGVQAVQVPRSMRRIPVVTRKFVDLAHDAGLAVHVWTINEPAEMTELVGLGVDGIVTDVPTLAAEHLDGQIAPSSGTDA